MHKLSSALNISSHFPLLKPLSSPSYKVPNSVPFFHNCTCLLDFISIKYPAHFALVRNLSQHIIRHPSLRTVAQSSSKTALQNPTSLRPISGSVLLPTCIYTHTHTQKSETLLPLAARTKFCIHNGFSLKGTKRLKPHLPAKGIICSLIEK
jgi:hypothetical protein